MTSEIYPITDRMLTREDHERLLQQKGCVLWFTGLSGSGKSTLALALERELYRKGRVCRLLDGDNVRGGICAGLGFSQEDRKENIRRVAEVARLFKDTGIITLCSFVSPTHDLRDMAREIIGEDDFIEVYVSTPIEVCEERDVKGLYAKARQGAIKDFTGVSAPYEAPRNPQVSIDTSGESLEVSIKRLLSYVV
jgi:adenylylsulfate kinase